GGREKALGLDARCERVRPAGAREGGCAADAARLFYRRPLQPRLYSRARELRGGRHLEGRARIAGALPGRPARAAGDPRPRRPGAAMAGRLGVPEAIRERLPDVNGKHVLHLQCATGESTVELVELGALVTGVDVSAEAIAVARERAPTAVFLQSDVQQLPLQLERSRFDVVYTGGGIFSWLHDLDAWAHGVASALKPGGRLLAYDEHPV